MIINIFIRLTVTDSDGEEDHDDVTVTVLPGTFIPFTRIGKAGT